MFDGYWKRRAQRAESTLVEANTALDRANEAFDSLQKLVDNRAALVSITPSGRKVRLLFMRNNELTTIDAYATVDADWKQLERKLLG